MIPSRTAAARRLDLGLVALALLAATAAGLHDWGWPWDGSLRGQIVANYSHRFLQEHVSLGLGTTRGACISQVDPLTPEAPYYYGNHPATCTLLLLPFAALFGDGEDTLRVAATLIWLPAVLALWRIARRWCAAPGPGAAALLFATLPMNALWGPSPHVHCAVVSGLLLAALAFVRQLEQPGRGRALVLALAVLFACLTDWPGMFALPMLFGLALAWPEPRRAFLLALRVAPCALAAFAAIHAHTLWYTRGALDAQGWWLDLFQGTHLIEPTWTAWVAAHAAYARDGLGVGVLVLAVLGGALAQGEGDAGRRRIVAAGALMLPGLLNLLIFRRHAIVHPFWGMYGTAGLALLAAAPLGALWEAARGRVAAVALLVSVLVLAVVGLGRSFDGMTAARTTDYRELGAVLDERYGRGDLVVASVDLRPADVYTRALLVAPVTAPAAVEALLRRYAPPAFAGRLGFVLPAQDERSPLAEQLARVVEPRRSGRWLLFDLR